MQPKCPQPISWTSGVSTQSCLGKNALSFQLCDAERLGAVALPEAQVLATLHGAVLPNTLECKLP